MFRGGFGCEKVRILVVIWMLFASVFVLRVVPEASATRTWIVDNTGGGDFTTINGALSAASDGDTIYVRYGTGTYTENLVVSKKVNIIGEQLQNGMLPTISAADQSKHVIEITTYGVIVESFKITGAIGGNAGIFSSVPAPADCRVRLQNLKIYSNSYGIEIIYTSDILPSYHVIDSCEIYNNYGPGILIFGHDHYIKNCRVHNNVGTGIYTYYSWGQELAYLSTSIIEDTEVNSNQGYGIYLVYSYTNQIKRTDVWNNYNGGVYINGHGNIIDGIYPDNPSLIHDNFFNGVGSGNTDGDVTIIGHDNLIRYYEIYQSSNKDNVIGIAIHSDDQADIQRNVVENCIIYGYWWETEDGGVGIYSLWGGTEILGADTKIYYNYIGVYSLSDTYGADIIDCQSYNNFRQNFGIFSNWIGVKCSPNMIIKNTFFSENAHLNFESEIIAYDGVQISYCKFQRSPFNMYDGRAISIGDDSHRLHSITIQNCMFSGYHVAIELLYSSYNSIKDCEFQKYHVAIYIDDDSTYNEVVNCKFSNVLSRSNTNDIYSGVILLDSDNNYINDSHFDIPNTDINDIDDDFIGIYMSYSENNEINNCEFFNKSSVGGEGNVGLTIGIKCYLYADDNKITKCDFKYLDRAMAIYSSQNLDVFGDSLTKSEIRYCSSMLYVEDIAEYAAKGRIKNYSIIGVPYIYIYGNANSAENSRFEYHSLSGAWILQKNTWGEWVYTTGW